MARHTTAYRRRGGFTLVEMLVSTALIIFVLLIITTVFTTGIGALRALRGAGHLQDEARHAVAALRRDLAAPHFGRETDGLRGPNLSQQRLDLYDWTPPAKGFFRITQLPELDPNTGLPILPWLYSTVEGIDGDQLTSTVATRHSLHFTVRVEPNSAQGTGRDSFSSTRSLSVAPIPATVLASIMPVMSRPDYLNNDGLIYSPWMEVAYFLRPSNQLAGSAPLYTLYRRRRVLLDIPSSVANSTNARIPNSTNAPQQLSDVSLYEPLGGFTYFNTPADVTAPLRRLGMKPLPPGNLMPGAPEPAGVFNNVFYRSLFDDNPNQTVTGGAASPGGDDILLENVLSFEIKATWDVTADQRLIRTANGIIKPKAFTPAAAGDPPNPDYPFDNLPLQLAGSTSGNTVLTNLGARVFDTWRGEDYIDPNLTSPVRYSLWNSNYELSNTAGDPVVTIPLRIRVKAIQIRIRVWDSKTQQTRQVTVVQDL